jgi:hypothetical protein
MTNLNKHESAADEAKDAHDAASLATLAAAFDRLVSVLESLLSVFDLRDDLLTVPNSTGRGTPGKQSARNFF